MSVDFRGYYLEEVEGTTNGWKPRTGSYIAIGNRNGCRYQMKCYKAAPYPLKDTPMNEATRQQKIKRAQDLFRFRKEISTKLKAADGSDHLIGYAEEVFLNETAPANGVVEAVAYIEGAQDYKFLHGNSTLIEPAFLQIADAVSRMHNLGIIHTDIKPENMVFVLDSASHVHATLIDFDKCCYVGQISEDTGGTAGFQAPELISMMAEEDEDLFAEKCAALDQAIDIFALGASFLLMLTGSSPKVQKDHNKYKVEWDQSTVTVPYLTELFNAMLAPDPKARPDADAVVESLKKRKFIFAIEQFEFWPEHREGYKINPAKEASLKRVSCEVFNEEHGYEVLFRTGDVRHFSFKQMRTAFIMVPANNQSVKTLPIKEIGGSLSPEDEKIYRIDTAAMASRHFIRLTPLPDGYEVEKADGSKERMDLNALKFFRVVKRKS